MKEKEATTIGCIVGLCALLSAGCNLVRSILSTIHIICNGSGEERGGEGACGRREYSADQRGAYGGAGG
jgi:hypothetical protein